MNIDLLFGKDGDACLVADKAFPCPVAAALYDSETYTLTLELSDMDSLALNIPVEVDYSVCLTHLAQLHIGILEQKQLTDVQQVPLVLLEEPFGGVGSGTMSRQAGASVSAFEYFLRQAQTGQPIHRDDLGDEKLSHGVMSGMNSAVLQFAPQLARQRTLEASPQAAPRGPSAPGLGPSGSGAGRIVTQRPPPSRGGDFEE